MSAHRQPYRQAIPGASRLQVTPGDGTKNSGTSVNVEDLAAALDTHEEAERVYREEKLFRQYVDRRHAGHCDVEEALNCIEPDDFLVRMLSTWDDDPLDG